MTDAVIGVDIGGTKIAAGLVEPDGRISREMKIATPADAAGIPAAIAGVVDELAGETPITAVGIGAAGFVSTDRSTVLTAPNIAWRDEPLGALVAALIAPRTGEVIVTVENDANAAAWGEFRFGAGRGSRYMLAITVGTGIGGGIVVDGELMRGAHGIAAEVGHTRFERDGLLCGCGQRGCLEQYASGTALVRRGQGSLGDVTGPEITRRAAEGDIQALAVMTEFGHDLGEGLSGLIAVLDPEVVVIGGGVAESGEHLLTAVRQSLEASVPGAGTRPMPRVVAAQLGNAAGIVGAADLARRSDG